MPFSIVGAQSGQPVKTPRQNMLLLCVETIRCPVVETRFFHILNSEAPAPAEITIERGPKLQWICILFDPRSYDLSARLMGRIAKMPAVADMALMDYSTRSLFDPDDCSRNGNPPAAALLAGIRRFRDRRTIGER